MPSVSYNGQSFAIDGRRIWILAASLQYVRIAPASWPERIAAAKQAGFNTIDAACVWSVHEPRRGRYVFEGAADLRAFIEACGNAGMKVILRVGPFVGAHFDAGGLPGWLIDTPEVAVREANEIFLEHVSRYFRRLLSEVADLQATEGGPILLIQSEHAWTCTNEQQAQRYLHEITRFIRESGITVPIINANDLWQESPDTVDTWRGYRDLLSHVRQLRTLQANAPRLVSEFKSGSVQTWGSGKADGKGDRTAAPPKTADEVLRNLAEVLAGGAQVIVAPFHGGTNFGFLGGRLTGGPDRFVCTRAIVNAPLGEAGERGQKFHLIKRLMTFANHFAHVFADLDPDYHPIVLDPDDRTGRAAGRERTKPEVASGCVSVVPQRGPQGRIVFVFGTATHRTGSLVLDNGIKLPFDLGDQPVGWYALDVDLHGIGRLDYANVCPWAIIDRSIVVFHGPAKANAILSISDTPLDAVIPADGKPLVVEHRGLTLVICSQSQIDMTYHDDAAVYVGIGGFDGSGAPIPAPGVDKAWVIRHGARIDALSFAAEEADPRGASARKKAGSRSKEDVAVALSEWQAASGHDYVSGKSPRFASLDGPETLSNCGAPLGYGWYRVALSAAGRKLCHLPHAADRVHLYLNGESQGVIGVGPGAESGPVEMKLTKTGGHCVMVALVDNLGRFSDGNDIGQRKGWFGDLYEVKAVRGAKPKIQAGKPVNPVELRGFIAGRDADQMSEGTQLVWSINHTRKTPLIVDIQGVMASGTLVLNDVPVHYYAGSTGACMDRIVLDPRTNKHLRRGRNTLRFAPDLRQGGELETAAKSIAIYEAVASLTDGATWGFAKWEPPPASSYAQPARGDLKQLRGKPCWWRIVVTLDHEQVTRGPLWLDTNGLSKGQAFVNGENLGRYFTATHSGQAVGPQTRLYIPQAWFKPGQGNEFVIFDEHGHDPWRTKLASSGNPDESAH